MAGITVDFSTNSGKVRLLIPDTDPDNNVFDDDEIDAFLDIEFSNVRRATALALETIASSEAYTLKHITALDLSTDGPSVARELRERAKSLRDQAKEDEAREEGGAFDFAEWVHEPSQRRQKIINTALENQ